MVPHHTKLPGQLAIYIACFLIFLIAKFCINSSQCSFLSPPVPTSTSTVSPCLFLSSTNEAHAPVSILGSNKHSSITILLKVSLSYIHFLSLHMYCAQSLSCIQLFETPWTVAHQAPLSIEILQARILEWVAMLSSRVSSQPRD